MDMKKFELQKLINEEHGINFHKNINLSGYVVYRKESFIVFHFVEVNGINTVVIDYIYITGKTDLLKLLSFCINFWSGNTCKFIYYKEHKRQANYVKKYFSTLGFEIMESEADDDTWKYEWTSTNGFKENEILEAYV